MSAPVTTVPGDTRLPPASPRRHRIAPLSGYTVAVASDRRRHRVADMLEAAGARTVSVQALRTFAQGDDAELRAATLRCLEDPIDELIVASDIGFRGWLAAAGRWRLADALVAQFAPTRLLASNPRAADSLREVGLREIWSTSASHTEDLVRYLMAQPMRDRRVVVQADAPAAGELCHTLRAAGAHVVEVPTYRCAPPAYSALLRRLGDQVVNRHVDAVALIGAAAGENLVDQAIADGRGDDVLNALATDVPAVCLGELSAAPLVARGVTPLAPSRPYLDELTATIRATVPVRAVTVTAGRSRIEVRGQAVLLDGDLIGVQPGPIAVLRALAQQPGRVLSCADIRHATPGWSGVDDHAIEMAVSRLRRSLPDADLIQTVMKRGYRLVA